MIAPSLRQLLRDHTDHLHKELDTRVGLFGDDGDYRRYLRGTWRFRTGVEDSLPTHPDWSPLRFASSIRSDLIDLGEPAFPRETPAWVPANRGEMLGAWYVLEGSALGARMLVGAAQTLGYSAAYGARHLHLQAEDRRRWPAFIAILDTASAAEIPSALAGADATFRLAITSYLEPALV